MKVIKNEATWIKSFIAGDNHALTQIVNIHYHLLLSIAFKRMKNKHDAEDVLQDFYFKIFGFEIEKRTLLFSNLNSIQAYLCKALINFIIDQQRRKKQIYVSLDSIPLFAQEEEENIIFEFEFDKINFSKNELKYLKDYLCGNKIAALCIKYKVCRSTIKNTLQNAKQKIKKHYRNTN